MDKIAEDSSIHGKERIFSYTITKDGFRKRVDWLIDGETGFDIDIDSPDLIDYGYIPQGEEYLKEKKRAKSLYILLECGKLEPDISYRFALSESERDEKTKGIVNRLKQYIKNLNEGVRLTVEDVLVRDVGTFERAYLRAKGNEKSEWFKF